ncbi:MAG: NnrU family protein [Burkholderiales bacterium]|nr:NnrU family protein [Burkholderiales bacterium]
MSVFILGMIVFFGVHSLRIFAEGWRRRWIERIGPRPYKGIYSLLSLAGLALLVRGYGQVRGAPVALWDPPAWTRHLASLVVLAAFVLMAAAYVPRNRIRIALGHPMILGVTLWALAHLAANGTLAGALLFGAFLVWGIFDYRAARLRGRPAGQARAGGGLAGDAGTLATGVIAWAVFAFWLHAALIGVAPFG